MGLVVAYQCDACGDIARGGHAFEVIGNVIVAGGGGLIGNNLATDSITKTRAGGSHDFVGDTIARTSVYCPKCLLAILSPVAREMRGGEIWPNV